jgi:hypothetical protein
MIYTKAAAMISAIGPIKPLFYPVNLSPKNAIPYRCLRQSITLVLEFA